MVSFKLLKFWMQMPKNCMVLKKRSESSISKSSYYDVILTIKYSKNNQKNYQLSKKKVASFCKIRPSRYQNLQPTKKLLNVPHIMEAPQTRFQRKTHPHEFWDALFKTHRVNRRYSFTSLDLKTTLGAGQKCPHFQNVNTWPPPPLHTYVIRNIIKGSERKCFFSNFP